MDAEKSITWIRTRETERDMVEVGESRGRGRKERGGRGTDLTLRPQRNSATRPHNTPLYGE